MKIKENIKENIYNMAKILKKNNKYLNNLDIIL